MLLLFHDHKHNVNCRNTPWFCLELTGTQKCILPFQCKIPQNRGVRSAGGNVGYNMFLIQLMAACATQYDGCGLFWSVSSCMFVFAPDFKDAPFSEPCGAIKARWLTCSDLPKWHLHAPKIPMKNHRAHRMFYMLKGMLFHWHHAGDKKGPSLFSIQWQLCHWLWLLLIVVTKEFLSHLSLNSSKRKS